MVLLLLLLILFGGSSSSSSGASRRFPSGRLAIRIRGVGHFPEHRGGVMFRRHDTTTNAHTSSRANTSRLSLSSKRPPPTPQKRSSSTPPLSLRLGGGGGGGLLLFFEGAHVKVPSKREVMATKRRRKEREDPTEKRRGLFRVSKRSKKERKISANFFIPFNDFLRTLRRRRRRLSEDDVRRRRRRRRRRRTGGSPLGALSFSLFLFFSFFLSAFFRWPRSFRERVKNVAVKRKRL